MLQAHGTTRHELTQNTAGQSQPQDSHAHMTASNAMEYTNAKQMLIHIQDIGQRLQRTPLTRLPPGHNSVHSQTISKCYITHQTLADGQNTNTTRKRKRYWPDKLLVINCVKFHLTISNISINIIRRHHPNFRVVNFLIFSKHLWPWDAAHMKLFAFY